MSFYDWMFALHLLAAFAVAAALVLFSVLVYRGRRMKTLDETRLLFRLAPVGSILIAGGLTIVVGIGVYLAIASNRYEIWNLWVIAAIVLAIAFGGVGQRSGAYYTVVQELAEQGDEPEVMARLRAPTGASMHLATVALFVLIVLDMIFKPGA